MLLAKKLAERSDTGLCANCGDSCLLNGLNANGFGYTAAQRLTNNGYLNLRERERRGGYLIVFKSCVSTNTSLLDCFNARQGHQFCVLEEINYDWLKKGMRERNQRAR